MVIVIVISQITQTLLDIGRGLALGSGMEWARSTRTLVVRIDVRVIEPTLTAHDEARSTARR